MTEHHLMIVEGAHDAAFIGKLLGRRGFSSSKRVQDVPEFWQAFIPQKYPVHESGNLDRIITFPDIYLNEQNPKTFAVSVASSDTLLIDNLRVFLDVKSPTDFCTITLCADTDFTLSEDQRFHAYLQRLEKLNNDAVAEGQPGFPLALPTNLGVPSEGAPKVGIYLWPGNGTQGVLESVLLECSQISEPILANMAVEYVDAINDAHGPPSTTAVRSSSPSGRLKAICGSLAAILKPGGSLAVSLRQSHWLPENDALPDDAKRAGAYIDALIAAS